MRAVNLLPGDARLGHGSGGSGGVVYVLLGGLVALALVATMWALTTKQIGDSTAKLERVNVEATAAEERAAKAAPYVRFAQLARDRVATVSSLSSTRFDFAHGLAEMARVLPDNVWLTTVTATSGASGERPSATTSAAPSPKFELEGCTRSQSDVARLMARLRAVDGVQSVDLRTSQKPENDAGPAAAGGRSCPANKATNPAFTLAIAFGVPGSPKPQVDATGQIAKPGPAPGAAAAGGPNAPASSASLNTPAPPPVNDTAKAG